MNISSGLNICVEDLLFYKSNYGLKKYFSHNHVIWDSFTLNIKTVNVVLDVCLIENLIHVISKLIKGVSFSSHLT